VGGRLPDQRHGVACPAPSFASSNALSRQFFTAYAFLPLLSAASTVRPDFQAVRPLPRFTLVR
jgi:hypothetical protein